MAGTGGDDEDDDIAATSIQPQELEKLETVEIGHHEVEKQQLRGLFEHPGKGRPTIGVGLDLVTLAPKDGGKKLNHVRLVVHDVDSIHSQLQTAILWS